MSQPTCTHTFRIAAIGDYGEVAVVLSFPSATIGMTDLGWSYTYGCDQQLEAGPLHQQIVPLLRPDFTDESQ